MKAYYVLAGCVISAAIFQSCKNADACTDLNTGETITVIKDEKTGEMVDEKTGNPVVLYVNSSKDTIYGPTGEVVNNKVTHTDDGKYVYASAEVKTETVETHEHGDDYKMKVEKDGDVKIKDGDTKTKIDGETGEKKVKED